MKQKETQCKKNLLKQSATLLLPVITCPAYAIPAADPLLDKLEEIRDRLLGAAPSAEQPGFNAEFKTGQGTTWLAWGNWGDWPNFNNWGNWGNY